MPLDWAISHPVSATFIVPLQASARVGSLTDRIPAVWLSRSGVRTIQPSVPESASDVWTGETPLPGADRRPESPGFKGHQPLTNRACATASKRHTFSSVSLAGSSAKRSKQPRRFAWLGCLATGQRGQTRHRYQPKRSGPTAAIVRRLRYRLLPRRARTPEYAQAECLRSWRDTRGDVYRSAPHDAVEGVP